MTDEEIIEKIRNNTWWPFDRVDPKILEKVMQMDKKEMEEEIWDAPI